MEGDSTACFHCGHARRSPPLKKGQVIADRYELTGVLGRGGMGTVYEAHDRSLDERVALKVLSETARGSVEADRRFRTEIRLARKIRHPNVCAIHEYGELQDIQYIVMEFVDGQDLKKYLRSRGSVSANEAVDLARQIGEGLQAIHEAGVIHRDLKLANVMRDGAGRLRLMDFGIAKGMTDTTATATGQIVGTPEYMSPEQARGERVDARSDVYALSIVTYELLTGRVPFKADTPLATLMMHVHTPPPVNDRLIPASLVPAIQKALAKDPNDRYDSARAFVAALTEGALPDSSSARHGGPTLSPVLDSTTLAAPTWAEGPDVQTARVPQSAKARAGFESRPSGRPASPAGQAPEFPPAASAFRSTRTWIILGVVSVLAIVAFVLSGLLSRQDESKAAESSISALTANLVETQLVLARRALADKDFKGAVAQTARILELDSDNPEALGIREQGQSALAEIEASVSAARVAFARGDTAAASTALERVLARDPKNPVVAEIAGQLDASFAARASTARSEMGRARAMAQAKPGGTSNAAFSEGEKLASAASESMTNRQYTSATQIFLQARDAYDRARRAAESKEVSAARTARSAARPLETTPAERLPDSTTAARAAATPPVSALAPVTEKPSDSIPLQPLPPAPTATPAAALIPKPAAVDAARQPEAPRAADTTAAKESVNPPSGSRPAAMALLVITVKPAAEITLDGKTVGDTSAYTAPVTAGEHVIRFIHKNWQPLSRTVSVGSGERLKVAVDLKDEGIPIKK